MDLKESFDRATDGGPAHTSIEDRLMLGRRAVRTRRALTSAGLVAAAVLAGGVAWAVQPSPERPGDSAVATRPASATPSGASTVEPTDNPEPPVQPYQYDLGSAELQVAPGFVVERTIASPIARAGVVSSAAVGTFHGERVWVMAAVVPGRSGWASDKPAIAGRTFEQWVHELTVLNTAQMFADGAYDPGWTSLDESGVISAHRGATIIEQHSPARIDQAPADVASAAGMIEVDGALICVVERLMPGRAGVPLYVAESEAKGCRDAVPGIDYPGNPAS